MSRETTRILSATTLAIALLAVPFAAKADTTARAVLAEQRDSVFAEEYAVFAAPGVELVCDEFIASTSYFYHRAAFFYRSDVEAQRPQVPLTAGRLWLADKRGEITVERPILVAATEGASYLNIEIPNCGGQILSWRIYYTTPTMAGGIDLAGGHVKLAESDVWTVSLPFDFASDDDGWFVVEAHYADGSQLSARIYPDDALGNVRQRVEME